MFIAHSAITGVSETIHTASISYISYRGIVSLKASSLTSAWVWVPAALQRFSFPGALSTDFHR